MQLCFIVLIKMLKRVLLSVSAIALSFAAVQSSAKAAIEFPEGCRMGTCYTTTLESKEALRSNELGTLYLINMTTNLYPDNRIEHRTEDRQRFVNYHGTDSVTQESQQYVFCSKVIPSVLFESDGKYIMKRLALFESPSNANRGDHQTYLATCHNLAGPDYFSFAVETLLIREGYTTQFIAATEQLNVPNVLEMMELYPESY
ncbi:MAG: hypothetical protein HLUCCA11_20460 [Phormidesmis priestleyi Ana]|uniref:Uncharacterized protein n=1 Tax=Phormidesmis priestleyi Ana TaxID=1666911 RepID=A0A0P8D9P3_9CYAN|nr:MAG: hypothetical protein HLUCCA11_20460 [Phormidesmis priestleyi Ana]